MLITSCVAAAVLATANVHAQDRSTNNAVDNSERFEKEKGWNFYEEDRTATVEAKKRTSAKEGDAIRLLEKILKENKEQTKLQKQILAVLQDTLDPRPKEITLKDGTKCIANSSAECYQMPMIAEAKGIPALSSWMQDPTDMKKAVTYTRWQARHLQQVKDMGNTLQFAIEQFGKEAYPISFRRASFDTTGGAWGGMEKKHHTHLINSNADKMQFLVFIGKNIDLDLYSAGTLSQFLNDVDKVKTTFVFADEANKFVYEETGGFLLPLGKALDRSKKIVDKKAFEKYNIYATPSIVGVYTDKDGKRHAQTISVGRRGASTLKQKVVSFMEMKRLIDPAHTVDNDVWKMHGNVATDHFRNFYGYELNATVINKIKKVQSNEK